MGGELRTILNDFGAVKNWKENEERERQAEVENKLSTIQEEDANDLVAVISEDAENGGIRVPTQHNRKPTKRWGMLS